MPYISVIIPVYNCEKYLMDAVNSIRQQPVKDMEIILVDDGSTDSSGEICFQRIRTLKYFHRRTKELLPREIPGWNTRLENM